MNCIQFDSVSYGYRETGKGITAIQLVIPENEFLVLAGENGSGKSTLLRMINGLLVPDTGKVMLQGKEVAGDIKRARQLAQMVFQDADSQIIGETVYLDAAFGPENFGFSGKELLVRVEGALGATGLWEKKDHPSQGLSGGEKRRLAVSGVLALDPAVYLFDEPFANLDYPGIRALLRQMVSLYRKGKTLVVATHDIEKVAAHSTRMVVMENGKIVLDGACEALFPRIEEYGIRMPCATRLGLPVPSWLD